MYEKKSRDDVATFVQAVANHKDWRLNTDHEFLDTLVDGLEVKFNPHGYFLCPCRESWEDREKDKDVICPCEYATADLEEYGHCYCGLYLTKEFLSTGKEVEGIPERRPEEKMP